MHDKAVTLADRLAHALLAGIAGCITGVLAWGVFAVWLGRYFLSLENLHFLDTIAWFSIVPAAVGFLAPNLVLDVFGLLWKWAWKIVRQGPPPA